MWKVNKLVKRNKDRQKVAKSYDVNLRKVAKSGVKLVNIGIKIH